MVFVFIPSFILGYCLRLRLPTTAAPVAAPRLVPFAARRFAVRLYPPWCPCASLCAQNGLARATGILTRTTHVTGHLTDLGAAIGRMIKARAFLGENLRPFTLHLRALLFFLLGVVTISLTHTHLPGAFGAIDLCGFLYVLLGGLMLLNLFKA